MDALDCAILAVAVIFHTLDQGTGAIADAGDGYLDFLSHRHGTPLRCPGQDRYRPNDPSPSRRD